MWMLWTRGASLSSCLSMVAQTSRPEDQVLMMGLESQFLNLDLRVPLFQLLWLPGKSKRGYCSYRFLCCSMKKLLVIKYYWTDKNSFIFWKEKLWYEIQEYQSCTWLETYQLNRCTDAPTLYKAEPASQIFDDLQIISLSRQTTSKGTSYRHIHWNSDYPVRGDCVCVTGSQSDELATTSKQKARG